MKMNFELRQIVYCLLFTVSCFLFACGNAEYADFEKLESGLMYKYHTHGTDTLHPQIGEMVTIKLTKRLGDSIIESTEGAFPNGVDQYIQAPAFKGGIEEGIMKMVIGDSVTFLVSADSVYKFFPQNDSVKKESPGGFFAYDIKLMNIKSQDVVMWEQEQKFNKFVSERKEKEPVELSRYLTDNHVEAKPTPSGLYLTVITKGNGPVPKDGDSVLVHYTGSFLNGTIFDSSMKDEKPFGFRVGAKRVIEGWEQAIKMMKKGTTATIILPSSLAYDSTGWFDRQSGRFFIPPYAPMKFDIQLIDINPK